MCQIHVIQMWLWANQGYQLYLGIKKRLHYMKINWTIVSVNQSCLYSILESMVDILLNNASFSPNWWRLFGHVIMGREHSDLDTDRQPCAWPRTFLLRHQQLLLYDLVRWFQTAMTSHTPIGTPRTQKSFRFFMTGMNIVAPINTF
jgi:hypothetical protein